MVRGSCDPRDGSWVLVCLAWGSVVVCERWLVGWLPVAWLGCQGALVAEGSVGSSGVWVCVGIGPLAVGYGVCQTALAVSKDRYLPARWIEAAQIVVIPHWV